jgi:transcriptional regulator GlxA family with amidase domain
MYSMKPTRLRIVDPLIRRTVEAMSADPTRAWTVAALATIAGLSRAAFARRFVRAAGISPERWLTRHRLRTAAWHLLLKDQRLVGVAHAVGYACEFAFSKAFKRVMGVSPSEIRSIGPYPYGAPPARKAALDV